MDEIKFWKPEEDSKHKILAVELLLVSKILIKNFGYNTLNSAYTDVINTTVYTNYRQWGKLLILNANNIHCQSILCDVLYFRT